MGEGPRHGALVVRAYGKLNLYLDVVGKREDGFHDIETVFQSISLHDVLHFSPREEGFTLTISRTDLDAGPGNLVYRAATAMQQETGSGARRRDSS